MLVLVLLLLLVLSQVSLEALWWVVLHNLTPLNYVLALEASIWFIERAAMEHPKQKVRAGWLRWTAWGHMTVCAVLRTHSLHAVLLMQSHAARRGSTGEPLRRPLGTQDEHTI